MPDKTVNRMKSHDWILIITMVMVFVYGLLAFVIPPKDPETLKAVVALFVLVVTNLVTFKATSHQYVTPEPPPGTDSLTRVTTPMADTPAAETEEEKKTRLAQEATGSK